MHSHPAPDTIEHHLAPDTISSTNSTIHHYPAFIKHLSGIGAGLITHWCWTGVGCQMGARCGTGAGCRMVPDQQHHTSLSSIHQAFILHWCWIEPALVLDRCWMPDGCRTGAGCQTGAGQVPGVGWVLDHPALARALMSDTVCLAPSPIYLTSRMSHLHGINFFLK